jgi:hypothetical protein
MQADDTAYEIGRLIIDACSAMSPEKKARRRQEFIVRRDEVSC